MTPVDTAGRLAAHHRALRRAALAELVGRVCLVVLVVVAVAACLMLVRAP